MPKKLRPHKIPFSGRFCPQCISPECEHTRGKVNPNLLTQRMLEVLLLFADGHGYKEIAFRLRMSENAVKQTVYESILPRLGVSNRMEAARYAWEHEARLRGAIPDVYVFPLGI